MFIKRRNEVVEHHFCSCYFIHHLLSNQLYWTEANENGNKPNISTVAFYNRGSYRVRFVLLQAILSLSYNSCCVFMESAAN